MNVSIADAFNLGWKLAAVLRGTSVPQLLHSYSHERQNVAKELIDFDRMFAKLLSTPPKDPAKADAGGIDPAEFQRAFVKAGRFTAGVAVRYGPSLITGEPRHQHLAHGFEIGTRFHSAPVIRYWDAKRVHLGHTIKADGRWRLFAFAGSADAGAPPSRLDRLCEFLADSPGSPTRKYTPREADIDAVIDVRAIFQSNHRELSANLIPPFLVPQKGRYGLRDYEKVFCAELKGEDAIFERRGIDRRDGCIVVVRPDQFVAHVLPLDDISGLAAFFDRFMIASNSSGPKTTGLHLLANFSARTRPGRTRGNCLPPLKARERIPEVRSFCRGDFMLEFRALRSTKILRALLIIGAMCSSGCSQIGTATNALPTDRGLAANLRHVAAATGPRPEATACPGQAGSSVDPNSARIALSGVTQDVAIPCFGDFSAIIQLLANDGKGDTIVVESTTDKALGSGTSATCGTGSSESACGAPIFRAALLPSKTLTFTGGASAKFTVSVSSPSKIVAGNLYAASVYLPSSKKTVQTVNDIASRSGSPNTIDFTISPPSGSLSEAVVIVYLQKQLFTLFHQFNDQATGIEPYSPLTA